MIRKAIVGAAEVLVILLAAYAFFFLNVGRRTPYGHVVAILSTQPAHEAAEDVGTAGREIEQKVADTVKRR